MNTTHDVLYRVKKKELQEEHIKRGKLEQRLEHLEDSERKLDEEFEQQNRLVSEDNMYLMTYGAFYNRYKERKTRIAKDKDLVLRDIDIVLSRIHDRFGEMKKMHILKEREQERAREEQLSLEQKSLDEVSILKIARSGFEGRD